MDQPRPQIGVAAASSLPSQVDWNETEPCLPHPGSGTPSTPSLTTSPLDVPNTWPRSAQWVTACLLLLALILLAWHGSARLPWMGRPSRLDPDVVRAARIDLNRAERVHLLDLPGVGPALADRIIAYRDQQGGFQSVAQLREVEGIGPILWNRLHLLVCVEGEAEEGSPSTRGGVLPTQQPPTHQARKPRGPAEVVPHRAGIQAPPQPVRKTRWARKPLPAKLINVNHADRATLQKLPGVGPVLSQRIIDARQQQPFGAVEELQRVRGIGWKTVQKLRPYVVVNQQAQPRK